VSAVMKFTIPYSSQVGELKKLCTTLSLSALKCEHSHQSCLLFNGNRLQDEKTIQSSQLADGAKLILFLRHHHNCAACQNPLIEDCPTGRHVAVIIAEDIEAGRWDLRVVGGDSASSQKSTAAVDGELSSPIQEENHAGENPAPGWKQVRRALTCLLGEFSRREQEQQDRKRLQRELEVLQHQKEETEQMTQEQVSLLKLTESEIALKERELTRVQDELIETKRGAEQELKKVRRELEETKHEVQQVRSRSASLDRMPEMEEDIFPFDEGLSRSAPASMLSASTFEPMCQVCDEGQEEVSMCAAQGLRGHHLGGESKAVPSPTTTNMLDILAKQVEMLQQKMDDEVRRTSYCSVCMSKPFVWVFKCGHAKCDDCAVELQNRHCSCPECRKPLEDPRRLFWAACG